MADKSDYLHGRIQLADGKAIRLAVVYADGRDLSAVVEGQSELPSKARCAFKYDGHTVELLVRVVDVRQQGKETGAALSILSAYSGRGREHLEAFLASAFSITQYAAEQFLENEKGCFCTLDPKKLARRRQKIRAKQKKAAEAANQNSEQEDDKKTKRTPKAKRPLRSDVERRWQSRVRHIITGCVERGEHTVDAIIFEVSERGLRISVPVEELPQLDLHGVMKLYLAFPSGRLTIRARCLCRVAWWTAPENEDEATLGLEMLEVIDGVHGQQWSRFIAAIHASETVIEVGEHGKPRDQS
jgi:hypothetical protein